MTAGTPLGTRKKEVAVVMAARKEEEKCIRRFSRLNNDSCDARTDLRDKLVLFRFSVSAPCVRTAPHCA